MEVRENGSPIMKDEVEAAVRNLKSGKSSGTDNVPAELVKYGGEDVVSFMTALCQKIWLEKKWPKEWTQSLVIPYRKRQSQTVQKLQNHQPHKPPKQSYAPSHTKPPEIES